MTDMWKPSLILGDGFPYLFFVTIIIKIKILQI